jgi:hypothetical protein
MGNQMTLKAASTQTKPRIENLPRVFMYIPSIPIAQTFLCTALRPQLLPTIAGVRHFYRIGLFPRLRLFDSVPFLKAKLHAHPPVSSRALDESGLQGLIHICEDLRKLHFLSPQTNRK